MPLISLSSMINRYQSHFLLFLCTIWSYVKFKTSRFCVAYFVFFFTTLLYIFIIYLFVNILLQFRSHMCSKGQYINGWGLSLALLKTEAAFKRWSLATSFRLLEVYFQRGCKQWVSLFLSLDPWLSQNEKLDLSFATCHRILPCSPPASCGPKHLKL